MLHRVTTGYCRCTDRNILHTLKYQRLLFSSDSLEIICNYFTNVIEHTYPKETQQNGKTKITNRHAHKHNTQTRKQKNEQKRHHANRQTTESFVRLNDTPIELRARTHKSKDFSKLTNPHN